jgi:hypothetical protein
VTVGGPWEHTHLPRVSASEAWFWGVVDAPVSTEHGCAFIWRFDDFGGIQPISAPQHSRSGPFDGGERIVKCRYRYDPRPEYARRSSPNRDHGSQPAVRCRDVRTSCVRRCHRRRNGKHDLPATITGRMSILPDQIRVHPPTLVDRVNQSAADQPGVGAIVSLTFAAAIDDPVPASNHRNKSEPISA